MKWLGAEQINECLDYPSLVDWLETAHGSDIDAMDDLLLSRSAEERPTRHFLLRAAWQSDLGVGAKLVTVFPDNQTLGLPSVQGLYILFAVDDGRPLSCLDGTALTLWKTAADSALAARHLAREGAGTLLMVGAGAMAPHLIQAHLAVRPSIESVWIWNRTPERAERLANALTDLRAPVCTVADLERAVREADIIACATMSTAPLIRGEWLRPGTHLDLVGAFTPDMREADDTAIRRAKIFVDSRETTIAQIGELLIPIRDGVISEADILADHFQLCRGVHPGRRAAAEITLFKNGGGGHLDLMTARFILERADHREG
ncbi:ornithine cyclodeaminase [Methylocaldum marinum]|uniref:Ornithine cyclodeaminase n=1 Tax=Methylocaldum marinum TaxID=1432792 RepID=A0A250KZS4_9GAMM|nr:ornithine cyclodeaminase family protein [Methylocaldum marinum]BBA37178.1 ornithine cyclodeaminase [Methylocaldum marinum]